MIFADFMTVFTFAFALLLLALSASAAYGGFRAAPWAPTRKGDEERFLRLAGIKPGQKVYDLGCGDGRMLLSAARAGAIATGYEVSLLFYFITYFKILRAGLRQNCRVLCRDFWRADLSEADIVYFFLMPKIYPKLKAKLEKELKPGAKVLCYIWPIDGWTALSQDKPDGKNTMYLYQIF